MDATKSATISNSKMIQEKIQWPKSSSIQQQLSLPSSIIYYITKNPSKPETYLKMIQSCKYFFEKNPILVVKRMSENSACSNDEDECDENDEKCCVQFNVNKIASKFWLTKELSLGLTDTPNYISALCSKIYRCEIEELYLLGEKISFNDFQMLVPSVKNISLYMVQITYSNGNDVMLDAILEMLPNIENFLYTFGKAFQQDVFVIPETFKNILKLNNLGNLMKIALSFIPEGFEVADLSDFIKDHKDTIIAFEFRDDISEEYKNQLDALIDTVIESYAFNQIIEYDGQDEDKLAIMESRDIVHNMLEEDETDDEDDESDGDDDNDVYYIGWNEDEDSDDEEDENGFYY